MWFTATFWLRRWWKIGLGLSLGLVLGPLLLISLIVGGFWWAHGKAQPPTDMSTRIPVSSYAAASIQTLDCVRQGAKTCDKYAESKQYLIQSSAADGITYTSTKNTDPGVIGAIPGTKTVKLTNATTDSEWHAFAEAATLNGAANPDTVDEQSVTTNVNGKTSTGTFTVTSGKVEYQGTASFTITQQVVALSQITYTKR